MSLALKLIVVISIMGLCGVLIGAPDMNDPNTNEPNSMTSTYGAMSGMSSVDTSDPNKGGCVPRRDANEPNRP